jgi:hypothetical protein
MSGDEYVVRTYSPVASGEVPCVSDAVGLYRQVVEADRAEAAGYRRPPDVDVRYIVGFVDATANAMALCDPWCQDAADEALWQEMARTVCAGPGVDGAYRYARSDAWRGYIRRAAADTARTFVPQDGAA